MKGRHFSSFFAAFVAASLLIFTTLAFSSCKEKIMGYSVALWNIPEEGVKSGDVLPVYIKSNISHVYIVEKSDGTKIEVPLWQVTEPVKKGKIQSVINRYSENARTYASVKTDGLPCRAEAVNTSKQVYRLRKGEVIKILYKGKGQAPMTGGKPLEGDWYRILTDDGTMGWCFSYNLNLYETDDEGNRLGGEEIVEEDEADTSWERIIGGVWYPEYFRSMIDNNNIDISLFHPSYKFQIDLANNKVILNTSKIHGSWDFTGFDKTDDKEYQLKGISLKVIYKKANFIVVRYTGEDGKPQDLNFLTISENITELISAEKDRRSQAYMQVWSHGPIYSSSNYGKLTFNENGVFTWTGFKLLVPSVIPAGTKSAGTASVKYTISKSLAANYDGVLTFKFDGSSGEVNFLYKLEDSALRLEDATSATFDGNQLKEKGMSPVILYFQKK